MTSHSHTQPVRISLSCTSPTIMPFTNQYHSRYSEYIATWSIWTWEGRASIGPWFKFIAEHEVGYPIRCQ